MSNRKEMNLYENTREHSRLNVAILYDTNGLDSTKLHTTGILTGN